MAANGDSDALMVYPSGRKRLLSTGMAADRHARDVEQDPITTSTAMITTTTRRTFPSGSGGGNRFRTSAAGQAPRRG